MGAFAWTAGEVHISGAHPTLGTGRWYLTGDFAYFDETGTFHCLGRIDNPTVSVKPSKYAIRVLVRRASAQHRGE